MENKATLLTGKELVAQRLKSNRDLPLVGTKDFAPTGSWLEGKQIQKSLEERYELIREPRIEKVSSLSSAEWVPEARKAKVTKIAGRMWETFGHHQDGTNWLQPEEALFLVETNALLLMYNNVQLSIERSYAILLDPLNKCTWNEYTTYSNLVRIGYKLIRHSPDVTVTRYEKQINLDHVLSNQKRNTEEASSVLNVDLIDISKDFNIVESAEDVCIIEENQDIICIGDAPDESNLKKEKLDEVICIDDDEESIKEEIYSSSSESSDDSSSSGDVVFVSSNKSKIPNACFSSLQNFLKDDQSSVEVIDLCDENNTIKKESLDKSDLTKKSRAEILDLIPSAKNGISYLRRPDPRLLPSSIVPQYSEYRVNLNVKPVEHVAPFQYPRPYYRNNPSLPSNHPSQVDQNIVRQAQELQVMAVGMMQFASNLLNLQNGPRMGMMGGGNRVTLEQGVLGPNWLRYMSGGNRYNTPRGNYHHRYYGRRRPWCGRPFQRRLPPPPTRYFEQDRSPEQTEPQHDKDAELIVLDSEDDEEVDRIVTKTEEEELESEDEDKVGVKRELASLSEELMTSPDCKRIKTDPVKSESVVNGESSQHFTTQPTKQVEGISVVPENIAMNEIASTSAVAVVVPSLKEEKEDKLEKSFKEQPSSNNQEEIQEIEMLHKVTPMEMETGKEDESKDSDEDEPELEERPEFEDSEMNGSYNNEADSWAQFKQQHETVSSPLSQDCIEPILKPKDCTSIGNILSCLQIFEPFEISSSEHSQNLKISFDMYLPSTQFKKSLKQLPNYRVIVLGSQDDVPSPSQLSYLQQTYQDGIPFLFAIVLHDSVAFYLYANVNLPQQID